MEVMLGSQRARPSAQQFQQVKRPLFHPPGAANRFALIDRIYGERNDAQQKIPGNDVDHL